MLPGGDVGDVLSLPRIVENIFVIKVGFYSYQVQPVAGENYINPPVVELVVEVEVDVVVGLSSSPSQTDKSTMKMKAAAKETNIRSVVMMES